VTISIPNKKKRGLAASFFFQILLMNLVHTLLGPSQDLFLVLGADALHEGKGEAGVVVENLVHDVRAGIDALLHQHVGDGLGSIHQEGDVLCTGLVQLAQEAAEHIGSSLAGRDADEDQLLVFAVISGGDGFALKVVLLHDLFAKADHLTLAGKPKDAHFSKCHDVFRFSDGMVFFLLCRFPSVGREATSGYDFIIAHSFFNFNLFFDNFYKTIEI